VKRPRNGRIASRLLLAAALASAPSACEAVFPLDGYEGTPDGGDVDGSDDRAAPDAPGDEAVDDGDTGPRPDAADGGQSPDADVCARFTRGPKMVRAGAICIDSTEVTEAQYQLFIAAKAGDAGLQPPECSWNTTWVPATTCPFDPSGHAAYPVEGIDWCDAYGYCAWAGKRLCGRVGGGTIPSSDASVVGDYRTSERTAVCTQGGALQFPYGNVFDPNGCNGGEHAGPREPVPVETTPGCQGGYPGVFDMAGNVHEWENACDTTTSGANGANDVCAFRGGSFHDVPQDSCATTYAWGRAQIDCDIGFRCCADP